MKLSVRGLHSLRVRAVAILFITGSDLARLSDISPTCVAGLLVASTEVLCSVDEVPPCKVAPVILTTSVSLAYILSDVSQLELSNLDSIFLRIRHFQTAEATLRVIR